ncbi:Tetratricopeptide repeat protein [Planctomycetes bacterium Poly30]|uniref:Tetratricopeptide repeat protein n=1 Tax=Saltatorellus ferox TaxID=2528018 RepID=A0A518F0L9_9BACT|nr:Tetratricopeptide repeat protein [Planctomycetes bacterium Poly30]
MKRFLFGTLLFVAIGVAAVILWMRSGGGTIVELSDEQMEVARASGAASQEITVDSQASGEAPLPTLDELKQIASRERMNEIASRIRSERSGAGAEERALLTVLLSEVERLSGDVESAYALAREGAEALPENSRARHMLAKAILARILTKAEDGNVGALFAMLGEVKSYKAEVNAAVELDPGNVDARVGQILAMLIPGLGNRKRAEELIEELAPFDELRRDYWRAQLIAVDDKRLPEAIEAFDALVKKYPGDPDMLLSLGELYLKQESWEKAIAPLDQLKDEPKTPFYYRGLYQGAKARVHLEGREEEALARLSEFEAANPVGEPMPTMDAVKFEKGRLLTKMGRRAEAVATLEEALELKPDDMKLKKALEEARSAGE